MVTAWTGPSLAFLLTCFLVKSGPGSGAGLDLVSQRLASAGPVNAAIGGIGHGIRESVFSAFRLPKRPGPLGASLSVSQLAKGSAHAAVEIVGDVDGGGGVGIHGLITMHQIKNGPVLLTGRIVGLPRSGRFGFHFHTFASPARGHCQTVGEHLNPFNSRHGDQKDSERHLGDLGNIISAHNGVATIAITDRFISLRPNHEMSVIGRPLVVHLHADDLGRRANPNSAESGNSGPKIACGNVMLLGHR